jgi:hypothetical protein
MNVPSISGTVTMVVGTPDPGTWGNLNEGAVAVPPSVGTDAPVAGFDEARRLRLEP